MTPSHTRSELQYILTGNAFVDWVKFQWEVFQQSSVGLRSSLSSQRYQVIRILRIYSIKSEAMKMATSTSAAIANADVNLGLIGAHTSQDQQSARAAR